MAVAVTLGSLYLLAQSPTSHLLDERGLAAGTRDRHRRTVHGGPLQRRAGGAADGRTRRQVRWRVPAVRSSSAASPSPSHPRPGLLPSPPCAASAYKRPGRRFLRRRRPHAAARAARHLRPAHQLARIVRVPTGAVVSGRGGPLGCARPGPPCLGVALIALVSCLSAHEDQMRRHVLPPSAESRKIMSASARVRHGLALAHQVAVTFNDGSPLATARLPAPTTTACWPDREGVQRVDSGDAARSRHRSLAGGRPGLGRSTDRDGSFKLSAAQTAQLKQLVQTTVAPGIVIYVCRSGSSSAEPPTLSKAARTVGATGLVSIATTGST